MTPPLAGASERYFSAGDAARLAQFQELLADGDVDVLMAARGGFGCVRLLDSLDWELLRRRQAPIVGYSDLTILHLACLRAGVTTGLSGPMVAIELGRSLRAPADRRRFAVAMRSFVEAWTPRRAVWLPPGASLRVLCAGDARGPVVPANLSVLVSLVGTPYLPCLDSAILVIEDVHEAAHRVERYLVQLRQSGVLQRLAALVFGRFTEGEDSEWLPEIFADSARHVAGPVLEGLPYGHVFPSITVPVGRIGELRCASDRVEVLRW